MFHRVAIVNRGEPARRLIHAVRELNHERGTDLRTIALHTAAERTATFVRDADEGCVIGTPGGPNPYLDHGELERALRACRADSVWVGWGFVAEDPAFADLCAAMGLTFVGPPGDVMRKLGDKIAAKLLAEQVGVPVAEWSRGPVETDEEATRHAAAIGYPLMIKAAAGGGGRGIRVVSSEEELLPALESARDEGLKAFGDASVLMERMVSGARHVEVQVIADHHGNGWAVGVRDCSVQRRSQKLIEESASPVLPAEREAELRRSSVDLVLAAGYRGAGTVEFLYQPQEDTLAFLEVNTRLQVEHPVSEVTTGLDLVKLQLRIAAGGRLEGDPPAPYGHAIEARVNAEDPERGFAPAPGRVEMLALPTGPGIRIDTGVSEGDEIPSEYDSMIAKVIAWGCDRDEARARLRRALAEMSVVIQGGATNRAFLMDILDRPEVISGSADTRWLDRLGADGGLVSELHGDIALIAAAIEADRAEEALKRERFYASARRGRPKAGNDVARDFDLRHRGEAYRLSVARVGSTRYHVTTPDGPLAVEIERLGRFESRMTVGGRTHRVVSVSQGPDNLVEVDGISHRVSRDEGGLVRAPAPALVVALTAAVGDRVSAGAPVVVLESMKMETSVAAPCDGVVLELLVAGNVQVDAGAPLMRIEPTADDDGSTSTSDRVAFDAGEVVGAADPRARATEILASLRALVLGYDVTPREASRLVEELRRVRDLLPSDDPVLVGGELDVLGVVADLAEVSRARPPLGEETSDEESVHSPREHFHKFLRSLDAEREGVPESLRASLERAMAHYGVDALEPGAALAQAAYRMYLAQDRASSQFPAIAALLDGRLSDPAPLGEPYDSRLREILDRLVSATRRRQPALAELARSVRFGRFERPLVDSARRDVRRRARAQLAYAAANPGAPDYEQHIEGLVASSQPLLHMLGDRALRGIPTPDPLLEVLTRRYYKIRDLRDLVPQNLGGRQVAVGSYGRRGRSVRLVTALGLWDDLHATLKDLAAVAQTGEGEDRCVVDVYVAAPEPGDPDETAEHIRAGLERSGLAGQVSRVAIAVAYADGSTAQFTFRPDESGVLGEERLTRGLHPMIWRRLRFWRMNEFTVSRLDSAEDTYLFHCTAPGDPSDERLVALAEVRDLTPVRNPDGRLVGLPEVERVLIDCLEGIRREQSKRSERKRLHYNHVQLFIWPEVELSLGELTDAARRLALLTEGLGLEEVLIYFSAPDTLGQETRERALRISFQPGAGASVAIVDAPSEPLAPVDDYARRVLSARRRGTVYPYELVRMVTGAAGDFEEYDLDESGALVSVKGRAPGGNSAGIVTGVVSTPTVKHPEGVRRVVLFGDPTRSLGSVAEAECRRIAAAIDLAESLGLPVEWFALSSGAKISRDSGTENMDWVAHALRRIVTFTQAGGEINVVVAGINVGAQPYWNAEATMLMHTKGILVMTPDSAMVLTGKQALDYSGGVSAEDNFGIGGFDRIMGPNGQAQYWAPHLSGACDLLMRHYEHSYVAPGESTPRRAQSSDPLDRDVCTAPHSGAGTTFTNVGEIFSAQTNPERKKPFDIRSLMNAVIDADHPPLERWAGMADAETAVVFDAHLGGVPLTVLGIESRPVPRHGFLPADGPDQWTAGTLFPLSSKKAARALNAASGNRPVVVLANLSGFDGSPESLRKWQLEYGAEIGRAVVNFDGPIIFCVVSRYHGGAFVVFSAALNDNMQVLAVEGSYASVIGGAPAAAVVFAGDVNARTASDPRVVEAQERLDGAPDGERATLRAALDEVRAAVRSEKLGQVATEFDGIHSVERAREVGSVHDIIPAVELRPRLIDALGRGLEGAPER